MNTPKEKNLTLTLNGLTLPHMALLVLSLMIIGLSLYMTNHFFNEHFPTTLGSDSGICDISSFWSCNSATFSSFSQVFQIPIAFYSLVLGLYLFVHSVFPSKASEKTSKFLVSINLIGCLTLFIYSLVALGSLCPLCTLYYVLSAIVAILFWKKSSFSPIPSWKIVLPWAVILIVSGGLIRNYHLEKIKAQDMVSDAIVSQFWSLPQGPSVNPEFSKSLYQAEEDAPITVSMFSDFQCPYCKLLAEGLDKAAKQFPGKVKAHYFSYPLDSACNPNIKSSFHREACKASYISYCAKDFKQAHDEIYRNQKDLGSGFLDDFIKKHNLEACVNSEETKRAILGGIQYADAQFQIKATPTLIINGVRIKPLPSDQFAALFRAIIKEKSQEKN